MRIQLMCLLAFRSHSTRSVRLMIVESVEVLAALAGRGGAVTEDGGVNAAIAD